MAPSFPQRHSSHTLENKSANYLRRNLPQDWPVSRPSSDYGQDFQIEIVKDANVTGQDLLIQLKASSKASTSNYETMRLKMSTYNYLRARLGIVILVKYVEIEDEAYWILLRDIEAPSPDLKSFTVRIPKKNRISKINWNDITSRIARITERKLKAGLRNDH